VMSEVLEETRAGVHALSKEQLRGELVKAYAQFRSTGQVAYEGLDSEVKAYTQQEMARQFAEVLDRMVGQSLPSLAPRAREEMSVTT